MTKALILAAGQGTRLRPLTDDRPKCLVTLNGKTLLDRQVAILKSIGINNIRIATGYRSDQIEKLGYTVSYNKNYNATNMVESLFCAEDFIRDSREDLIISYGDIVYERRNLVSLLGSDDEISLMVDSNWKELWSARLENPLDDAETLIKDSGGYIKELGKKATNYNQIQGQYTGLIKVGKEKIDDFIKFYHGLDRRLRYDGQTFENMYMTSFLQLLINSNWKVKAVEVSGGWLEVDTVEDLNLYNKLDLNGRLSRFIELQ